MESPISTATENFKYANTKVQFKERIPDPRATRLFWYLFAGSRGGETRRKIITLLMERPYNTNQLAETLRLYYKAIQHHLNVLEKNNLIIRQGEKYGAMFFISQYLEVKIDAFHEVCKKLKPVNMLI